MNELIEAIKAWPIIIQGALGSALFWLILVIGQRLTDTLAKKYSHHSREARLSWLTNEHAKLKAATSSTDQEFATYATVLLYRASRKLFSALMWLAMGLIFQSIFMPAGIVGFLGCVYYLFQGGQIIGVLKPQVEANDQIEAIFKELTELNQQQ